MNIGVCFGGYCPLHKGHLDLIMEAKKKNDMTYVIVCGYDDDQRGKSFGLNLIKRYRIIKNFLEDELLRVIYINDTELHIDESMCPSNWKIWTNAIRERTGFSPEDRITFYVAEPFYMQCLKDYSAFPCTVELRDRTINPISGTNCRENPLRNWSNITAPFRSYFSHNILITGTASEGKTTLTRDIGKYYGLPYSYEKGRDNCHLKTDPEFNVKDFIYNIYEQHKYNEELITSPQNPGIFISDTDNLVTLMYAYYYSQRDGFAVNRAEYDFLVQMAKQYRKTTKWDKIFLLAPHHKGIVDDGERYMPDSDYEIRCEFFNTLKKLYDEFEYEYEILDGTYYDNFMTVRRYIDDLYAKA